MARAVKGSAEKRRRATSGNLPLPRSIAVALVSVLGVARSAGAFEEDVKSSVAKEYQQAVDNYKAGQYCEAAQGFQRALDAIPLPVSALWAARAQVKCGDLVAATKTYEAATHLPPNELWIGIKQQRAQVESADELEALRRRVPHLAVNVSMALIPDSQVTVDGATLPHEAYGTKSVVNPGSHVVILHRGDYTVERRVSVAEGQSLVVELQVEPKPQPATTMPPAENATTPGAGVTNRASPSPFAPVARPPAPDYKTATVVAVTIGAAGVTAGVIMRVLAFGQKLTIDAHCDQAKTCDASGMEAVNRANSFQIQSTIYFSSGLPVLGPASGSALLGLRSLNLRLD